MSAERILVGIEKYKSPGGRSLLRVESYKRDVRITDSFYDDKESALADLKESKTVAKICALMSGGFSIGSIILGTGILLGDSNIGQFQIAAGVTGIMFGGLGVAGVADALNRLKMAKKQLSAVENFNP